MTDAVDQAQRDLHKALTAAGAALTAADEAYSRLCALTSAPVAEPAKPEDRRYVPGPLPPDWHHVSELAHRLKVSPDTAWRLANVAGAQWPYGKKSRKVDMSKFRDVLPDLP